MSNCNVLLRSWQEHQRDCAAWLRGVGRAPREDGGRWAVERARCFGTRGVAGVGGSSPTMHDFEGTPGLAMHAHKIHDHFPYTLFSVNGGS